MLNNTELITIFRESLTKDTMLLETHPGPPELGGATQQHLATHFKLNTVDAYSKWAPEAMLRLAQMVNSFPGPYQFYELGDPKRYCAFWTTIDDPEICIRQFNVDIPEEWTEPGPGLTTVDLLAGFKSRKRWDDHVRITFEVIFQFSPPEYPETD